LKLAVIWSRFGPYHLARLAGAARAGAASGVEVVGIEIAAKDSQYEWALETGARGFERVTVFADCNYHTLSTLEMRRGVYAALERLSPEAVAINGWSVPEARAALDWCRNNRRQAILMSESKADDSPRQAWKEAIKRLIVRRYDDALVGGRPHARYLVSLGFPADRIRLGYNTVDNNYFASGTAAVRDNADRFRDELSLPRRFFFACTRFLERKNVDGLLRAYAVYRAQTRDEPWGLVIAGSGDQKPALTSLERYLGVEGVQWPGFVQYTDLPTYYALATAFVHPAKSEPWGLVVNEAAASGLPLLVSRTVGSASELVVDGETGWRFDPFNDASLVQSMVRVAALSDRERARVGDKARCLVSNWGPERFGDELVATLSSASGASGRAAR